MGIYKKFNLFCVLSFITITLSSTSLFAGSTVGGSVGGGGGFDFGVPVGPCTTCDPSGGKGFGYVAPTTTAAPGCGTPVDCSVYNSYYDPGAMSCTVSNGVVGSWSDPDGTGQCRCHDTPMLALYQCDPASPGGTGTDTTCEADPAAPPLPGCATTTAPAVVTTAPTTSVATSVATTTVASTVATTVASTVASTVATTIVATTIGVPVTTVAAPPPPPPPPPPTPMAPVPGYNAQPARCSLPAGAFRATDTSTGKCPPNSQRFRNYCDPSGGYICIPSVGTGRSNETQRARPIEAQ